VRMQSEFTDMVTGTQEAWHPMTGRLGSAFLLQVLELRGTWWARIWARLSM